MPEEERVYLSCPRMQMFVSWPRTCHVYCTQYDEVLLLLDESVSGEATTYYDG